MAQHRSGQSSDARRTPRLKLPPMYTFLRARPAGTERYCWSGHIYDISASGMRFELDVCVDPGRELEIRAMLPGASDTTITAIGRVVRLHDDSDERGPVRMAMVFSEFAQHRDRLQLDTYLARACANAA